MHVKEKKTAQIELFNDLIYVYAISRMTLLIEKPVNGIIPLSSFFSYLIVCFVILQAWLYLTNYVNRYGQWKWYEYLLTIVNMTAAMFMAGTIGSQWNMMSASFNLSMLVMLMSVAAMYAIQIILKKQNPDAAENSLTILCINCGLYFAAYTAALNHLDHAVILLDIAAVLCGAFLPFFLRGKFDISIISFPHLMERFELITIITFGESVVDTAGYFDEFHLTMKPFLAFAVLLSLFGCYTLQIHDLCSHHRVERALRLMFSHYFIVISLNLMTEALLFLNNPDADLTFTCALMFSAMAVFFIALSADHIYYHEQYSFTAKDIWSTAALIAAGALVSFLLKNTAEGFLMGVLTAAGGNFACLLYKYRHPNAAKPQ